jgi:hypothetical protein
LGAKKEMANPSKLTAYGLLRKGLQGMDDFRRAFGMQKEEADKVLAEEALALLKPENPTEADLAVP